MALLTEIAEVELLGTKYKLGKNGNVTLVSESPDAWGKIRGDIVPLRKFIGEVTDDQEEKIQALLDQLGDALARLRQSRDSKLGVGQGKE